MYWQDRAEAAVKNSKAKSAWAITCSRLSTFCTVLYMLLFSGLLMQRHMNCTAEFMILLRWHFPWVWPLGKWWERKSSNSCLFLSSRNFRMRLPVGRPHVQACIYFVFVFCKYKAELYESFCKVTISELKGYSSIMHTHHDIEEDTPWELEPANR